MIRQRLLRLLGRVLGGNSKPSEASKLLSKIRKELAQAHEVSAEEWNRLKTLISTLEVERLLFGLTPSRRRNYRLERAIEALEETRWNPTGPLQDWARTAEGQNHARVIEALEILRRGRP